MSIFMSTPPLDANGRAPLNGWVKWLGLALLATAAALGESGTEGGKFNWFDFAKHECSGVGLIFAGGKTKFQ